MILCGQQCGEYNSIDRFEQRMLDAGEQSDKVTKNDNEMPAGGLVLFGLVPIHFKSRV